MVLGVQVNRSVVFGVQVDLMVFGNHDDISIVHDAQVYLSAVLSVQVLCFTLFRVQVDLSIVFDV